jgi:hypothetical protein
LLEELEKEKQEEIQYDSRSLERILNPEGDQPEKGKKAIGIMIIMKANLSLCLTN